MVRETDDPLLLEQIEYYRAVAPEYEKHSITELGAGELTAAVDAFGAAGNVLELACGPGTWTERLLRSAASVTAVDAAPEVESVGYSLDADGHVLAFASDAG